MKLINKILLIFSFLAIESKNANKNKSNVKIEAFDFTGSNGILIIKVNNKIKKIRLSVYLLNHFYQKVEKQASPGMALTTLEKMMIPCLEEHFKEDADKKIKELDNQVLFIYGDNKNEIKILFINEVKINHNKIITLIKTLEVKEEVVNKVQDIFKDYKYYSNSKVFILRPSNSMGLSLFNLPEDFSSIVIFINKKADELQMTKEEKVIAVNILQRYYYDNLSDIMNI